MSAFSSSRSSWPSRLVAVAEWYRYLRTASSSRLRSELSPSMSFCLVDMAHVIPRLTKTCNRETIRDRGQSAPMSTRHIAYRADHVGSLLRPKELLEARTDPSTTREQLTTIEDTHILAA